MGFDANQRTPWGPAWIFALHQQNLIGNSGGLGPCLAPSLASFPRAVLSIHLDLDPWDSHQRPPHQRRPTWISRISAPSLQVNQIKSHKGSQLEASTATWRFGMCKSSVPKLDLSQVEKNGNINHLLARQRSQKFMSSSISTLVFKADISMGNQQH